MNALKKENSDSEIVKTLIIIPAHNEELNIANVIREVRHYNPNCGILVVNDCSTDRTGNLARKMNVQVIDLPFNLG